MEVAKKQELILLVDDEPAIVSVMKEFLKNLEYEVIATTSGQEALDLFQQYANQISVVITNLSMPKVSGIDLTKKIKGDYPNTPIILCTGYGRIIGHQRTKELDIAAYLGKPVTQNELGRTLHEVLTQHQRKGGNF